MSDQYRQSWKDSNRAMLNINRALGFKPHMSRTFWQVETIKIADYLLKLEKIDRNVVTNHSLE